MSRGDKLAARFWLVVAAMGFCGQVASAQPIANSPGNSPGNSYETVLGPTPITHTSKATLTGDGGAIATLSGDTLKVAGTFEGLSGPATDAHIMMGEGIGIPGDSILDLTNGKAVSGSFSGTFKLNRAQLAALRNGRLYIQVNSQIGPAPGGNLWGWLLPEHAKAGQDEPQMGSWFLPQGEGLRASRNRRSS